MSAPDFFVGDTFRETRSHRLVRSLVFSLCSGDFFLFCAVIKAAVEEFASVLDEGEQKEQLKKYLALI